jgi:Domain of unknown function (DUF4386)
MTAEIINSTNKTSLRTAALIAGLAILTMAIVAPFAELFAYPKLVIPENAVETIKNILANQALFISAIFAYLITFICDLLAAWALYILLKPVNENMIGFGNSTDGNANQVSTSDILTITTIMTFKSR